MKPTTHNVFFAIFLLANIGFIGAITPRILVSKTSLTIDKGSKDLISFNLDEPIICPSISNRNCSVTLLLTNPNNKKIALDNCKIKWNWDEWSETRYLAVTSVENFINDVPFEGFIKTEPVISNSEYYSKFDPPDIFVKTVTRPSATCSGTGDPHYTTFDGAYWHVYYSGNYVLYKSLIRDFEVQVAARGYPSQHCGFAAKENNDIVVVYACDGNLQQRRSCGTSTCTSGSFPKIKVSGRSFQVEFQSGALVRLDYYNNVYGNMYVTAPGQDYKNTVGICGNFNSIRDDDVPIYVATSQSQMRPEQIPNIDLFNWYPSSVYTINKPPYVEECKYTDPIVILPILNNPDAEDITRLIKNIVVPIEDNNTFVLEPIQIDVNEEDMFKLCDNAIRNAKSTQTCSKIIPNFDIEKYIGGCVEDMLFSNGDIQFIELTLEGLENDCKAIASTDQNTWEKDNNGKPIEPNKEIQINLCPNNCNGNGICQMAKCVCNNNFKGADCSLDITKPPTITALEMYNYDTKKLKNSPTEIHVYGENFWNSVNLKCKFGSIETMAFYMGSSQVICSVPKIQQSGSDEITVPVSITTDNITWSNSDKKFTYYDSICEVCVNNVCNTNPTSCTINGVCKLNTEHFIENVCLICNSSNSNTEWSYSYKNKMDCGPIITNGIVTVRIVESNKKKNVFYRVDASNPLTRNDPLNKLSYKLINTHPIFSISTNGEIYTNDDLIVNSITKPFNNLITYQVTDYGLNTVSGQIVVDLIETNQSPLFSLDNYIFNTIENIPLNTVIGKVTATDKNSGTWGKISYKISSIDGNDYYFEIDSNTGEIQNIKNIDYESNKIYNFIVTARDGGGQFHMAHLTINILNQNESPYDITISSNKINENMKVGTIVGYLKSFDPDDIFFKYEINSTDFIIRNETLFTNKIFDFEKISSIPIKIKACDPHDMCFKKDFIIYINNVNEAPYNISLTIINISEHSKVDSVVSEVLAMDPENDKTYCSVINSSPFIISSNKIVLIEKLDYETSKMYNITISCIDLGIPPQIGSSSFIINVINENEGAQYINFDMINIPENLPINTFVGKVNAKTHDINSNEIKFSTDDNFYIKNTKCIIGNEIFCEADIYLNNEIDFESNIKTITIFTNVNNIINTNIFPLVILDQNDKPFGLIWKDNKNEIIEYSLNGTIVGYLIVNDQDIYDEFEVNTYDDIFQIRKVGTNEFEVTVKNTDYIRYDLSDKIQFDVIVSDKNHKITFPVIVNVLDASVKIWIDKIGNNQLLIKENQTINSEVGQLILTYVDDSIHNFELQIKSEYLEIKENKLILIKKLDYELESKFDFQINNIPFNAIIENINEPPFILSSGSINIDIDTNKGTTLVMTPQFEIIDPEGDKIIFSIPFKNNNEFNIFKINPDTGSLRIEKVPSQTQIKLGFYKLKIGLYDGINYIETFIKYQISNGCTKNENICGIGKCVPKYKSYECICPNKKVGLKCDDTITKAEEIKSNYNDMNKSSIIGIAIGISLIVIIIVLIGVLILRKQKIESTSSKKNINGLTETDGIINPLFMSPNNQQNNLSISMSNPTYDTPKSNPTYDTVNSNGHYSEPINYVPLSVANPIYDWYKPDLNREEAEAYLFDMDVGSFVVRDSKATPGWHMFSIKKTNEIIHQKIRYTQNGMYEMIIENRKEPLFNDIPSLVNYYGYEITALYDNPKIKNTEILDKEVSI